MRVGLLSLMVFLCGCVYVPPVWDAGDEIYHLDFIEPGVTTKDQVLTELGEPDKVEVWHGRTSYVYEGSKSDGILAVLFLVGEPGLSSWRVNIEFDENDVVSKVRTSITERVAVPDKVPARLAEPTQYFSMQLKKACGGDKLAQYVVAKSYDSGEGIERDKIEALKWYSLAESEWPVASKFKDRLRRQMTLAEVAEAERRVAEWKPSNCEAELEEAGISPTN